MFYANILIQYNSNIYKTMLAHYEHELHNTKGFLSRDLAELSMTIILLEF